MLKSNYIEELATVIFEFEQRYQEVVYVGIARDEAIKFCREAASLVYAKHLDFDTKLMDWVEKRNY